MSVSSCCVKNTVNYVPELCVLQHVNVHDFITGDPTTPKMTFCCMLDYNVMNNFFLIEKKFTVRNWRSRVTSDDSETTATQYQYELYVYNNSISLAFKQAHYELCTEQVTIFNKGVSKKVIFYDFHMPGPQKLQDIGCSNSARKSQASSVSIG
jgi:hypothetical protein